MLVNFISVKNSKFLKISKVQLFLKRIFYSPRFGYFISRLVLKSHIILACYKKRLGNSPIIFSFVFQSGSEECCNRGCRLFSMMEFIYDDMNKTTEVCIDCKYQLFVSHLLTVYKLTTLNTLVILSLYVSTV